VRLGLAQPARALGVARAVVEIARVENDCGVSGKAFEDGGIGLEAARLPRVQGTLDDA